ncbi:MAG: hypothetical protein ICV73_16650 [Acetobacteraceae bacterium]|nr:hypothetical protein [Acetobacteraceae bacterium]
MSAAKGAWAATKAARPPKAGPCKADDFKRAVGRAMEGLGPSAPPSRGGPAHAARPAAAGPHAATTAADAAFRARIARAETGAVRAGEGYGARNAASGALGRYQLTPQALRDLGWKDAAGGWTALAARHGIGSDAEFLSNPAAQEAAMGAYLRRAEAQLDRNGSLSRSGGTVAGLDGAPVLLTEAGLVAAAHRRGAASVARYLAHRSAPADAPLPTTAERRAFAAVERRLRDFAELSYTVAARPGRGGAPAA